MRYENDFYKRYASEGLNASAVGLTGGSGTGEGLTGAGGGRLAMPTGAGTPAPAPAEPKEHFQGIGPQSLVGGSGGGTPSPVSDSNGGTGVGPAIGASGGLMGGSTADLGKKVDTAAKEGAAPKSDVNWNNATDNSIANAALGSASAVLDGLRKSSAVDQSAQYARDLAMWEELGKGYFDPNYDVSKDIDGWKKDIDAYIASMPKGTESLTDSQLIQNDTAEAIINLGALLGMAAWGEDKGMYVGQEAWFDAVEGYMSGGIIGAVVGGVMGIFEASGKYDSAKKADDANKKRLEQLKRLKLKAALKAKEDRRVKAAGVLLEKKKGRIATKKADKEKKRKEKATRKEMARRFIVSASENARTSIKRNQARKMKTWGGINAIGE